MKLNQDLINTLQGIHDGKPWQWMHNDEWLESKGPNGEQFSPFCRLSLGHEIRLKPEPEPDPYAEAKAAWEDGELQFISHATGEARWRDWPKQYTPAWVRPPSNFRRKPKPVRVPLGPEDVPPGSVLRGNGWDKDWSACWMAILETTPTGVHCNRASEYAFTLLQFDWRINRSLPLTGKWNANAWEPCWKEVQP